MYNNIYWSELYRNLRKAHSRWGVVAKVLDKTGGTIEAWVIMCNVVVQEVIIYGSEIGVVTGVIMMVLEEFHHSITIRIVGMT